MVAVEAGALSVAVDLVVLAVLGFGQSYGEPLTSSGLLFRSVAAPLAGTLVPLGLYARQSEATGVPGLAGFLVAFVGTVLAQGSASAGLLADLGPVWGGQPPSRVYPRAASILLIVGAVGTAVSGVFPRREPGSLPMYAVVGTDVILNPAIVWLGYNLFAKTRGQGTGDKLLLSGTGSWRVRRGSWSGPAGADRSRRSGRSGSFVRTRPLPILAYLLPTHPR